jgi:transcription elongation factor Elf1
MANNGKVVVSCPRCGCTGTFNVGIKTGHGSSPAQCRQCNGSFRIHLKNGDVYKVA